MKRTPLSRGTSQLKRSPINPVSAKRKKENRVRSKILAQKRNVIFSCQAQCIPECTRTTDDGHEILTRARGGSIIDPDNIVLICRPCHQYLTENPLKAAALGLMKHSWDN